MQVLFEMNAKITPKFVHWDLRIAAGPIKAPFVFIARASGANC